MQIMNHYKSNNDNYDFSNVRYFRGLFACLFVYLFGCLLACLFVSGLIKQLNMKLSVRLLNSLVQTVYKLKANYGKPKRCII